MLEGNLSKEEYKIHMQIITNPADYYKKQSEKQGREVIELENKVTELQTRVDYFEDKHFWNEQYQRVSTPNTIKGIENQEFLRKRAMEEC